jgi:hypothetical protein
VTINVLRVGQVPLQPLTVTLEGGDPGDYDTVEVRIVDPNGDPVTLPGDVTVNGQTVSYEWGAVSPFTTPGDYAVSLVLSTAGGAVDYTTTDTIEVYR